MLSRPFVVLYVSVFVAVMGISMVTPLLPVYAERLGATGAWIGLTFSIFAVTQAITSPFVGRASNERARDGLGDGEYREGEANPCAGGAQPFCVDREERRDHRNAHDRNEDGYIEHNEGTGKHRSRVRGRRASVQRGFGEHRIQEIAVPVDGAVEVAPVASDLHAHSLPTGSARSAAVAALC